MAGQRSRLLEKLASGKRLNSDFCQRGRQGWSSANPGRTDNGGRVVVGRADPGVAKIPRD